MDEWFLVDTSIWTIVLRRRGDDAIREHMRELIANDQALWCDPIRLELWRGVRSAEDREDLHNLEKDIRKLPIESSTWDYACRLAERGRLQGKQFPPLDVLIFSCARENGVVLLSRDKHFNELAGLDEHL